MDIKRNIGIIAFLWILILTSAFFWNYAGALNERTRLAFSTSRSFFKQIVSTRQWNAHHGGVYVPVNENTRPNPYLHEKDRDIIVSEELILTKINPAYMTRQIAEIAEKEEGLTFNITSLKPIRPENEASEREKRYLRLFEQGIEEDGAFFEKDRQSWFFYMAPLVTTESCLQCHAEQGYELGDIRGGISVAMPFDSRTPVAIMFWSHLAIGVLGVAGLLMVGRKLAESYDTIKRQAVYDDLTGIPNRRSFTQSIQREFNRSRRENYPLSVIISDIDNFKVFNDYHGHAAGDECLKKVAAAHTACFNRPGDFCARYGGEEFVAILANTDLEGAAGVAERLRRKIANLHIEHRGPDLGYVTVSLGVAAFQDDSIHSGEELLKHADDALYRAKSKGKNRVEAWSGEETAHENAPLAGARGVSD